MFRTLLEFLLGLFNQADSGSSETSPKKSLNTSNSLANAKINEAGLKVLKSFEGLRLKAYRDIGGILTIGYGHTGPDVKDGLMLTEAQVNELLVEDLANFEAGVSNLVKTEVNSNQFSALVVFSYNVGLNSLQNSTLLKLLNSKEPKEKVAEQFLRWNKVNGIEVAGLTHRRQAEKNLFLS